MVHVADETGEPSAPAADVATADDDDRAPWTPMRVDWALIGSIVVAAFLRFWHIGTQAIWYDEYVTTLDMKNRLAEMVIANLPYSEGSPPLYFVAQWFWGPIAGRGDGAVRSLSAVIGIAMVPMIFLLARELGQSRRVARIAALITAVNPLFVWYSQEARPYALLGLTGIVATYFWARALHRDGRIDFIWWGIAATAAMCTHYFAIFLIVPQLAWLLYQRRGRTRDVLIGCIPLAILIVPLAVLAAAQRGKNQAWIGDFPLELRFTEMGRHFLLGPAEPFGLAWLIGLAVVVIAAVTIVRFGAPWEKSAATLMVGLTVAGFLLALAATVVGMDYILGRNLIATVVPLFVAVAIGLGAKRSGAIGLIATAVLCIGSVIVVLEVADNPDYQKPDWRAAAKVLSTGGKDRAVVVDAYLGAPLVRYLDSPRTLRAKDKKVKVDTIDLLYHVPKEGLRCGRWSGLACETFFFPYLPPKIAKQFHIADRLHVAGFVINRYTSEEPVRLSKRELLAGDHPVSSFIAVPRAARARRRRRGCTPARRLAKSAVSRSGGSGSSGWSGWSCAPARSPRRLAAARRG